MTDRELIELAAKAAGYEISYIGPSDDVHIRLRKGVCREFNPLTDDGDALRLEVDTNITTKHRFLEILAEENTSCNGDYRKARRRAIVRATAEIGKAML